MLSLFQKLSLYLDLEIKNGEVILNVQTLNIIFISASVCSVANGSPTEANYHVCLPKGR